eukprot:TRINITY_DN15010_c0_g1_i1.p1 TRINITY_DN15010_c0_g1~~TRINITY_DN15010_c0_g1_i1.p1  ORF type:complete len:277 (-),score=30.69 TRINITY_DN15010_c0_g1_i1:137-967(-)
MMGIRKKLIAILRGYCSEDAIVRIGDTKWYAIKKDGFIVKRFAVGYDCFRKRHMKPAGVKCCNPNDNNVTFFTIESSLTPEERRHAMHYLRTEVLPLVPPGSYVSPHCFKQGLVITGCDPKEVSNTKVKGPKMEKPKDPYTAKPCEEKRRIKNNTNVVNRASDPDSPSSPSSPLASEVRYSPAPPALETSSEESELIEPQPCGKDIDAMDEAIRDLEEQLKQFDGTLVRSLRVADGNNVPVDQEQQFDPHPFTYNDRSRGAYSPVEPLFGNSAWKL